MYETETPKPPDPLLDECRKTYPRYSKWRCELICWFWRKYPDPRTEWGRNAMEMQNRILGAQAKDYMPIKAKTDELTRFIAAKMGQRMRGLGCETSIDAAIVLLSRLTPEQWGA